MHIEEMAKKVFRRDWHSLLPREQRILQHFAERAVVSRDTSEVFDDQRTFGQRLADRVAAFGGSWTFIGVFAALIVLWVVLNSFILMRAGRTFDPYPYILLNLLLSMVAALQAPVIMMSQNRMAAKDRVDAAHDYEVNLKAELEILALHEKLDALRGQQWETLLDIQRDQIAILRQIALNPVRNTADHSQPEGEAR